MSYGEMVNYLNASIRDGSDKGNEVKKTIQGTRYNTDKATYLGTGTNLWKGDFGYFKETLYKTPISGRFFLHGEGHWTTRWAKPGILPITEAKALEWAEQYMDADDIEKFFGDMTKDA